MFKKIAVFLIFLTIITFLYLKHSYQKNEKELTITDEAEEAFKSNLLENVEYISKDNKGNKYIIRATKGEIDLKNTNIIFLEDVRSLIQLTNSDEIIRNCFSRF